MIFPIEDIITDIQAGRMVIMVDDEGRENEGDLIIAADRLTPEAVNFMATHGRGLICLAVEKQICERLKLRPMVEDNMSKNRTAFMVSIGAKEGITTGISVYDRCYTMKLAADPLSKPEDFTSPGHVFPLCAAEGGILARQGHTEAAVELARLAGYKGAGAICEIMKDDGTMARMPDLEVFAARHGLKIGLIADLLSFISRKEQKSA
jgi:3,4-dihydroxy 2-butanone 4-phosphate synthase/GTP cyclohydrolase II